MAAQYARPWRRIANDLAEKIRAGRWQPGDRLPPASQLAQEYGVARGTVGSAVEQLRKDGLVVTRSGSGIYVLPQEGHLLAEPANTPERPPVVAAIVTSYLGVLAGRRNDGKPPWTFIAGEIEPGESQADAAIREVKEEAGLEVTAGHNEIGRRVHPKTGRTMIYLACTPVSDPERAHVGDPEELAEVRWLSLDELDELMPGVYDPVREHLSRVIS